MDLSPQELSPSLAAISCLLLSLLSLHLYFTLTDFTQNISRYNYHPHNFFINFVISVAYVVDIHRVKLSMFWVVNCAPSSVLYSSDSMHARELGVMISFGHIPLKEVYCLSVIIIMATPGNKGK